jgi:hypothetical protein
MLSELIRKDLVLTRKRLLLNAGVFTVFLIFFLHQKDLPVGLYTGAAALMLSFMPITVVAHEDHCRAAAVGCSLPVRRRDIVRARYLLGLGLGVMGLAGISLLALAMPGSPYTAAELFAPATLLSELAVLAISLALFLPFTIRYGLIGILAALVALQALGLAVLYLANRYGIAAGVRGLAQSAGLAITRLHVALGDAAFGVAVLTALGLLLAVSVQISTWLFEHKDL